MFPNLIGTSVCKITYEGGCKEYRTKNLKGKNGYYTNREYTVAECYGLCENGPECGGFFIAKVKLSWAKKGACLLYRSGCTNDNNPNFKYYAMKDCATCKFFIFLLPCFKIYLAYYYYYHCF